MCGTVHSPPSETRRFPDMNVCLFAFLETVGEDSVSGAVRAALVILWTRMKADTKVVGLL